MKIDLLKSLSESALYKQGLSKIPESDRLSAKNKIESMMSELSVNLVQFFEMIQQSDDETKEKIRQSFKDVADLVIDVNQQIDNVGDKSETDG